MNLRNLPSVDALGLSPDALARYLEVKTGFERHPRRPLRFAGAELVSTKATWTATKIAWVLYQMQGSGIETGFVVDLKGRTVQRRLLPL
jgi:hypothetical protein